MNIKNKIIENIKENIDGFLEKRKKQLDFWLEFGKEEGHKIVVFGAAFMGEKICNYLEQMGVQIGCICDNDSTKWGGSFITLKNQKIAIMSPQEALKNGENVLCIIATGSQYVSEISTQLKKCHVKYIFLNKYPDFYLEAMVIFLNMKKEEILYKIDILFDMFYDEESFKILWCHIREIFGIEVMDDELKEICFEQLYSTPQYFFENGKYLGKQEVMIDCGAYYGDTVSSLVEDIKFDNFEEYICLELDPQNYQLLEKTVARIPIEISQRIKTYNWGVGRDRKQIKYNYNAGNSSVMCNGNLKGEIITLDEIFGEKNISFLKMDIEGSEQDALYGAQKIIRKQKPICAICIYHSIKDFFEIPLLLKDFVSEYNFILKSHSRDWPDTVCYARVSKWR